MARSPTRQVVIENGDRVTPLAEVRVLTRTVRVWRFFRGIAITLLILAAFGLGVITGTNGQFADGISELRRIMNVPSGSDAGIASVLDTLERLDASEGIDPVKTRHGLGQSVAALDTICRQKVDTVREETKRIVQIAMSELDSRHADRFGRTKALLLEVQDTAVATGELAALAEGDCGRVLELIGGAIDPLRSAPQQTDETD